MLGPQGAGPSGSVCLAHQLTFSEVPVTALHPSLGDRITDGAGLDPACPVVWFVLGLCTKLTTDNCLTEPSDIQSDAKCCTIPSRRNLENLGKCQQRLPIFLDI